jgi:hypothetical protein
MEILNDLGLDPSIIGTDDRIHMSFDLTSYIILCGIMRGISVGDFAHSVEQMCGEAVKIDDINRVIAIFPH